MKQELATLKTTITSAAMREQFAAALPKHLSPERFTRIAITAPIARALIGKEIGDTAQVRAPGGMREVEIVDVKWLPVEA